MDSIRIKRGLKAQLPRELPLGELAFCTDTRELYVGMGEGSPLRPVTNTEITEHLAEWKSKYSEVSQQFQTKYEGLEQEYATKLTEVNSKVKNIVPYYISKDFFTSPNIQARLEELLNNTNLNNIMFPPNIRIELEKQLVIHRDNLSIDFNGCTFQFPDSYNATPRYDLGESVGCQIVTFLNCNNIKIKNICFNGKRSSYEGNDNSSTQWQTGLTLFKVTNFECNFIDAREINYHAIVVYNGVNILFDKLHFHNNGGCKGGGYSDVYVHDDKILKSDVTFLNTYSTRDDLLSSNSGQIYYINNHRSVIKNIIGKNIAIPFDFRRGSHVVKEVTIEGALGLVVGTYPSNDTFPNITMENIVLTQLEGNSSGGALFFITACDGLYVKNLKLSSVKDYKYLYGISIKRGASGSPINDLSNIFMDGVEINISGESTRCVLVDSMIKDVNFNNLSINGLKNQHNAIITKNNTSDVIVRNCSITGDYTIAYESSDNKLIILNKPLITNNTPIVKPSFIGQECMDILNKKLYKALGTSSPSDWIALN